MSETIQPKVIRSRSKKEIGDVIEDKWRVTAIKVIAPPHKGNPPWDPPRQGVYDYTVEPTSAARLIEHARNVVLERTVRQLGVITNAIKNGNPSVESVIGAASYVIDRDKRDNRRIDRAERTMVSFRRMGRLG
jgi:hypothetical protein